MPLTVTSINSARPRERSYKLFDGNGLFLLVEPSGSKLWRLKYRFGGKERKLALGRYPETSLKEARDRRANARKLIEEGVDPGEQKRAEKQARVIQAANSFQAVAQEYIAKKEREGLSEITIGKSQWLLGLFGKLRGRPIAQINTPELLAALRIVETKGNLETARRMRSLAGRVFRYGPLIIALYTGRSGFG